MMTRDSTQRAVELAALIARHSALHPSQIAAHVLHLQRIARQLKSLAERACTGVPVWSDRLQDFDYRAPTEEEVAKDETRGKKLGERAIAICEAMWTDSRKTLTVEFGGDPRGPCLRLLIAGERGDGWGEGFAVY